jgi:hypothetical protein
MLQALFQQNKIPDSVNSHGPAQSTLHAYSGDPTQRTYFDGVNRQARKNYTANPNETSRPKNNAGRALVAAWNASPSSHPSNPDYYAVTRNFDGRDTLHRGGRRYQKPEDDDRYLDLQRKFARRQLESDLQATKPSLSALRNKPISQAARYWQTHRDLEWRGRLIGPKTR